MNDTLLQEWETTSTISLTSEKHEDWTAGLVVGVVKPVPQVERAIRVGLITGVIVEEVNGDREIPFRVQQGKVKFIVALI
jgi:hypothetical protein